MLGRAEINALLAEGKLMYDWVEENVRNASYDLRMSAERHVLIRTDGSYERVGAGEESHGIKVLGPGDFAVVSTAELLRLDYDIAGVVGSNFKIVHQGVLSLMGMSVDPGFGLRDPQALHLLIANISDRPFPLHPGETRIASIQFHKVVSTDDDVEPLTDQPEFDRDFFTTDAPPGFVLTLLQGPARLTALEDAGRAGQEAVWRLERQVEGLAGRVEGLHQGSQQIILFGVILVAATIAGVVASVLLQGGFSPSSGDIDLGATLGAFAAVSLFGVGMAGLTVALTRLSLWLVRKGSGTSGK